MLTAALRAFAQLGDPAIRRLLWLTVLVTLAALAGLVFGTGSLLAAIQLTAWSWLNWVIDVLGTLAVAVLAVALFPVVVAAVGGFFSDSLAAAVERRDYPRLPEPRAAGFAASLWAGLRFTLFVLIANLAALVLVYFIPVLNAAAFWLLNGWLLGREYFEMAALRHLPPREVARLRRRAWPSIWGAGILIAVALSVPFLNLLVPAWATLFLVHVFHRLAGRRPAEGAGP